MESSSPISIDLKWISCKGVKSFNLFQKPCIYAVISLSNGIDRSSFRSSPTHHRHKTPVDRTGGDNPEWDHPMTFDFDLDLDRRNLVLRFDLKSQGGVLQIGGDKLVGEVIVPLSGLKTEDNGRDFQHVSYQVRTPEGKRNGVLSFAYKLNHRHKMVEETATTAGFAVSLPQRQEQVSSPPPPPRPSLYPRVDFNEAVSLYPPTALPEPAEWLPPNTVANIYPPMPPLQDPSMWSQKQQVQVVSSPPVSVYPPPRAAPAEDYNRYYQHRSYYAGPPSDASACYYPSPSETCYHAPSWPASPHHPYCYTAPAEPYGCSSDGGWHRGLYGFS